MIKQLSLAVLSATVVLAGCNTMAGMGEDLSAGGKKLEHKAEEVKNGSSHEQGAAEHQHGAPIQDGAAGHDHGSMEQGTIEQPAAGTTGLDHGTMTHDHGSMGSGAVQPDAADPSAAQPTDSMTSGQQGGSSDPSLWEKTKEKASEVKDKVKSKMSK